MTTMSEMTVFLHTKEDDNTFKAEEEENFP